MWVTGVQTCALPIFRNATVDSFFFVANFFSSNYLDPDGTVCAYGREMQQAFAKLFGCSLSRSLKDNLIYFDENVAVFPVLMVNLLVVDFKI